MIFLYGELGNMGSPRKAYTLFLGVGTDLPGRGSGKQMFPRVGRLGNRGFPKKYIHVFLCSHHDSNVDPRLRSPLFYPVELWEHWLDYTKEQALIQQERAFSLDSTKFYLLRSIGARVGTTL